MVAGIVEMKAHQACWMRAALPAALPPAACHPADRPGRLSADYGLQIDAESGGSGCVLPYVVQLRNQQRAQWQQVLLQQNVRRRQTQEATRALWLQQQFRARMLEGLVP